MKAFILTCLISLSFLPFSSAQELSTSAALINLSADYPSGSVRAYNHSATASLNMKDGIFNIDAYNQGFQFKPKLKPALKKEIEVVHKFPTTSIKAQITNFNDIDFKKEGKQLARIIGRFIYNGVATTFYDKGQLAIEDDSFTFTMSVEVLLADYSVEGATEDATMMVDVMLTFVP